MGNLWYSMKFGERFERPYLVTNKVDLFNVKKGIYSAGVVGSNPGWQFSAGPLSLKAHLKERLYEEQVSFSFALPANPTQKTHL